MRWPGQDSEQIIAAVRVTIEKVLPLAKGGGVATAGQTVTQAQVKAAHEDNAKLWTSPKGTVERYYEVFPVAVGTQVDSGEKDAEGNVIYTEVEAPEMPEEIANQTLWYFPSDDGRAGRGMTLVGGTSFAQAAKAEKKAAAADPNDGNIAPTAPAPKGLVKPALKPLAVAAKPVAAPVAAKPALAIAKAPAPVAAPKPAAAPLAIKKPLILKR